MGLNLIASLKCSSAQVLRRQVRIAHGHGQRGMAQDLFQRDDMPTAHDEMSCEGLAQNVAGLSAVLDPS